MSAIRSRDDADVSNEWKRVGEAIAARMAELGMTKAELIRAADVSDKTLNGYLAGEPIVRGDKGRDLCAALGWTPGSIDLIKAGNEPVLTLPGSNDRVLARLEENHRLLVEILEELRARP